MPWKTARDNVAIALEISGTARREALERAEDWLEKVGLKGFGHRYPHMLSGGQRKRVAMAQVLIRDPEILLMDEPFGPLDAQTRLIMGDLLLDLWQQDRKAVMFVTHDLEEAIALADRVVIMSTGPDAKLIRDFTISLARPRDVSEIKLSPEFQELHQPSRRRHPLGRADRLRLAARRAADARRGRAGAAFPRPVRPALQRAGAEPARRRGRHRGGDRRRGAVRLGLGKP